MMRSASFSVRSSEREQILIITSEVARALRDLSTGSGLCTIFTPHTTAAITVNENADPDVPADLVRALRALVPKVRFDHAEGNSDAHFLASLIGPSVTLPFEAGRLRLGRWQGVFFVELDGPRHRTVELHAVE
jgi:secondary thiamine-phosphate synthase enzyme